MPLSPSIEQLVASVLAEHHDMSHLLLYRVVDRQELPATLREEGDARLNLTADAIVGEGLATYEELEATGDSAERVIRCAVAWAEARMRELTPAGSSCTYRVRVARTKGTGWIVGRTFTYERPANDEPSSDLVPVASSAPESMQMHAIAVWLDQIRAVDAYFDTKLRRILDLLERAEAFYSSRESRLAAENAELRRDNGRMIEHILAARVREVESRERAAKERAAASGGERDVAAEGLDLFKDFLGTVLDSGDTPPELISALRENPKLRELLREPKLHRFLKDPAAPDMLRAAVDSIDDDSPASPE